MCPGLAPPCLQPAEDVLDVVADLGHEVGDVLAVFVDATDPYPGRQDGARGRHQGGDNVQGIQVRPVQRRLRMVACCGSPSYPFIRKQHDVGVPGRGKPVAYGRDGRGRGGARSSPTGGTVAGGARSSRVGGRSRAGGGARAVFLGAKKKEGVGRPPYVGVWPVRTPILGVPAPPFVGTAERSPMLGSRPGLRGVLVDRRVELTSAQVLLDRHDVDDGGPAPSGSWCPRHGFDRPY